MRDTDPSREPTTYDGDDRHDIQATFFMPAVSAKLYSEEVRKIADGRIMTGSMALSLGLIDKLGDLNDAIELGATLAGITGVPEVIYPPKKGAALASLFGSTLTNNLRGYMSGLRIMYLIQTGVR